MAALATQNLGPAGGIYTLAAATGGGDTMETGVLAGGWGSSTLLIVNVGTTATVVTINGVAQPSMTSQTAVFPVIGAIGAAGGRVNITYSQVVNVTVGVVRVAPALTGVTFGT
jgi:hypothetical protein